MKPIDDKAPDKKARNGIAGLFYVCVRTVEIQKGSSV